MHRFVLRLLVVLTVILGVNYVAWRWLESLNWSAWWIAVPLVLAETYSLIDVCLFGLTMWRLKERTPPEAPPGLTVDVFITTYNEPIEMVLETALAAQKIRYPHKTWILDDGARPEMREAAQEHGIGYLTRSADWTSSLPRHAKAGNLNNALMMTQGEFMMILDADQIPKPEILDRTLGYFNNRKVALVQTPQWFINVPDDDPLGSQAPLFYGPLQQGKDGWNAAFFCGSNALLRREALMQLGLAGYVAEVERNIRSALKGSRKALRHARKSTQAADPRVARLLDEVEAATNKAAADLNAGRSYSEITYELRRTVDAAVEELVAADFSALQADLAEIRAMDLDAGHGQLTPEEVDNAVAQLSSRQWSPLGALESVQAVLEAISIERGNEAQPLMPLATISVTEDMATSMRLHALGWKSVYHHEILAIGLAPEDLKTMLTQRLRWAQGTIQVLLRENPLTKRGMNWTQRLMYFATMWSYLSGYAAVVYIAAPIIYLVLGILPVTSLSTDFFIRFIPFMIANQILFAYAGRGAKTWRGQQYSLALFPTWIRACTTAARNVWFGRPLGFAVTPKVKEGNSRDWHLIRPQLIAMGLLTLAGLIGLVRLAMGLNEPLGTLVNVAWVIYDLVVFSVLFKAVRYDGYVPAQETEKSTQQ